MLCQIIKIRRAFGPGVAEVGNCDVSADRARSVCRSRHSGVPGRAVIVIGANDDASVRQLGAQRERNRLKVAGVESYGYRVPGCLMNACAGCESFGNA
jgi:hypothetical protein